MKLKVCGMRNAENILELIELDIDYIGFIFYKDSSRNVTEFPELKIPNKIKKVGVFVNSNLSRVIASLKEFELDAVQFHGEESPEMCAEIKNFNIEVIKVFSIKDTFNFDLLNAYESVCDYYLFDTKGKLPGGNGYAFNWDVLENYPSKKPFFLSGGIGLNQIEKLKEFQKSRASKYCYAIDVNSQFETEPGLKHIDSIRKFKSQI